MKRRRLGNRIHVATIKQHDGTLDDNGQPTYTTSADWDTVTTQFVCELATVSGTEAMRGQQVAAETTHMLYGEYQNGKAIEPEMRAIIENVTYEVVSAYDPDGDYIEWHVECKREDET